MKHTQARVDGLGAKGLVTVSDDTLFDQHARTPLPAPPPNRLVAVLVRLDSKGYHESVPIRTPQVTIGRSADAHILVADGRASRIHAIVSWENCHSEDPIPVCTIMDNGSRNGTFVNNKPIVGHHALKPGDFIRIGNVLIAYETRTEMDLQAEARLRALAQTDQLTGLYNRSAMSVHFQREVERAQRYGRPVSVMMLDIDNFKAVNDTYGHDAGDLVISRTARILESQIRAHDMAARYGGEEFCLLLPETDLVGAAVLAERLRQAVDEETFFYATRPIKSTISIGVAALEAGSTDLDALIKRADEMLYAAKREGKNCVRL